MGASAVELVPAKVTFDKISSVGTFIAAQGMMWLNGTGDPEPGFIGALVQSDYRNVADVIIGPTAANRHDANFHSAVVDDGTALRLRPGESIFIPTAHPELIGIRVVVGDGVTNNLVTIVRFYGQVAA